MNYFVTKRWNGGVIYNITTDPYAYVWRHNAWHLEYYEQTFNFVNWIDDESDENGTFTFTSGSETLVINRGDWFKCEFCGAYCNLNISKCSCEESLHTQEIDRKYFCDEMDEIAIREMTRDNFDGDFEDEEV